MNLTPLSIKFDAPMPMNVIPKSKVRIEVVATMQAPRRTSQGSIVPHQRRVRIRIPTYVVRTYMARRGDVSEEDFGKVGGECANRVAELGMAALICKALALVRLYPRAVHRSAG